MEYFLSSMEIKMWQDGHRSPALSENWTRRIRHWSKHSVRFNFDSNHIWITAPRDRLGSTHFKNITDDINKAPERATQFADRLLERLKEYQKHKIFVPSVDFALTLRRDVNSLMHSSELERKTLRRHDLTSRCTDCCKIQNSWKKCNSSLLL